jgi:hypothetical protein
MVRNPENDRYTCEFVPELVVLYPPLPLLLELEPEPKQEPEPLEVDVDDPLVIVVVSKSFWVGTAVDVVVSSSRLDS